MILVPICSNVKGCIQRGIRRYSWVVVIVQWCHHHGPQILRYGGSETIECGGQDHILVPQLHYCMGCEASSKHIGEREISKI